MFVFLFFFFWGGGSFVRRTSRLPKRLQRPMAINFRHPGTSKRPNDDQHLAAGVPNSLHGKRIPRFGTTATNFGGALVGALARNAHLGYSRVNLPAPKTKTSGGPYPVQRRVLDCGQTISFSEPPRLHKKDADVSILPSLG